MISFTNTQSQALRAVSHPSQGWRAPCRYLCHAAGLQAPLVRGDEGESLLHSIIRLCPNLEVLNMYVDESWDGSNPLSETTISFHDSGFGRRLRWDEALMGSCIPFLPILHQYGIIEALILSLKVGEFPGTLSLLRLHTLKAMGDSLSLRPFIVAATSWSLPALSHVTLSLDREPGDAISSTISTRSSTPLVQISDFFWNLTYDMSYSVSSTSAPCPHNQRKYIPCSAEPGGM
jgi:hypothetical protein